MPRGGDIGGMDPAGGAAGLSQGAARYPLQGRHVCPFCGSVNETMEGPCLQCTMGNTAETRKATKSRIGPWYVLQSRNPAAPGMKYQTLLGFVRKGRVKARSIVRGPTTHQLWRFACQVKGLSREFGVCYSCGGAVERDAQLCPQCNRLQDPPADPDVFIEGQAGLAPEAPHGHPQEFAAPPSEPKNVQQDPPRSPIFRELSLPPAFDLPAAAPSRGETPAMPSAASAPSAAPSVFDDAPAPTTPPAAPSPGVALPPAAPAMAPQRPAAAAPASAGVGPPVAPSPASPAKRNANDVFLSAKDLAAAFQLGFDGDSDDADDDNGAAPYARGGATAPPQPFDPEAPWVNDAPATAAWPPRSVPRRRRKRRLGRMLLLIVLLAAGGFGGYLAVDGVFRRQVFDWAEGKYMALTGANLYPDLGESRKTTGDGAASPAAAPDLADTDDPDVDGEPIPAAVAPRQSPPPATLPVRPATQAASGLFADRPSETIARPGTGAAAAATTAPVMPKPPAPAPRDTTRAQTDPESPPPARPDVRVSPATQPVRTPPQQAEKKPDAPPQPTREQNLRKSAELWKRALAAEEAGDYRKAKATYEEIMSTLPRDVWYQGVESRLRVAKEMLGEK